MAATLTTQIELGFKAPHFNLPDTVSGDNKTFEEVKGEKGTLVMFICNHCPFVVHVADQLAQLAREYQSQDIKFVAISSNDVVNYPQDGPELMKIFAAEREFIFPYLYDETQEVARAYDAACTPDFSVFDSDSKCVYRGQLDDSRPNNDRPLDGQDIRAVFDSLLARQSISIENQKPSIGCNIKWK